MEEGDALFVDVDRNTRDTPLAIPAFLAEGRHPRWFCDIPEPAARGGDSKLTERLRKRKGIGQAAARRGPCKPEDGAVVASQAPTFQDGGDRDNYAMLPNLGSARCSVRRPSM